MSAPNSHPMWDMWKKGFDAWENATANYLEVVLKSPLMMTPAGMMLSMAMRSKARMDKAVAHAWGTVGLPSKRDQERTLHQLNQIQSRLLDLEEKLDDLKKSEGKK